MKTIKKGCPVCHEDVRGNAEEKYFCKKCNVLYSRVYEGKESKCITRESGWLYFVDKQGDISRVKMARSRSDKGPKVHEKIKEVGVKKEKGYLYYVNKKGCVDRAPMKRK